MISPPDSGNGASRPMFESAQYRNRAEIASILQGLICDKISITAEMRDSRPFVSRLLAINPTTGHFFIAYGASKTLNSILFSRGSVTFTASYQDSQISFEVSGPAVSMIDGQPAIRYSLPSLLILSQRRAQPRKVEPKGPSLRCIADEGGFLSFEARIDKLRLDGTGEMTYSSDINIEPGSILKASRIFVPGDDPVIADMEVGNISTENQPDGKLANRTTLRFRLPGDKIELLCKTLERRSGERSSGTK